MDGLTTDQKGNIAEMAVTLHATRLGIEVYRPAGEGGRLDMVFLFPGGDIARVQVKWANLENGVVVVRSRSARRTAAGLSHRTYTEGEIDAIAAYCQELDTVYYLPADIACGRSQTYLRVDPPRNGQRASLKWAPQYELGAVAQLEERRAGSAKVRGSSPLSSTHEGVGSEVIGSNEFRNRFGWYIERTAAGEHFTVTRWGKPYLKLSPP